jgi:hypothetical protein
MKDETSHTDSKPEASRRPLGLPHEPRHTDRLIQPRSWRQFIIFELIFPIILYVAIGSLFFFFGLKCR